jgi:hypothetical protein
MKERRAFYADFAAERGPLIYLRLMQKEPCKKSTIFCRCAARRAADFFIFVIADDISCAADYADADCLLMMLFCRF